jgi:hypothetical protein
MADDLCPLKLFREGNGYIEIGAKMGIHPSKVEKMIHKLRTMEVEAKAKIEARRVYHREYQRRQREELRGIRASNAQ